MVTVSDVSPGNSLFHFIDKVWKNASFGNNRSIHRLCTLMRKMGVQSVVTETLERNNSLLELEIKAIETHLDMSLDIEAYRITFFSTKIERVEDIDNYLTDAISSTIIINLIKKGDYSYSYLYQSIIKVPYMVHDCKKKLGLLNNYINTRNSFECSIETETKSLKFPIEGTFFCQQNTQTSVCAHATICMTLNNSFLYKGSLVTSEDINATLGIDHVHRKISGSLTSDEICSFLEKKGVNHKIHYFFENSPDNNFSEYLYRYIESKCPSMLLFTTNLEVSHIVPILGHTLNTDLWRPEAQLAYDTKFGEIYYRSASAWVDHWLIHDDNFGMYYCLPSDSFQPIPSSAFPSEEKIGSFDDRDDYKSTSFIAQLAISIIPNDINIEPQLAEGFAITILEAFVEESVEGEEPYWLKQLRISVAKLFPKLDPLVARTILATKSEFLLQTQRDHQEIDALAEVLPERFWLVEFSIPDLYTANKTKIAEIAILCDTKFDLSSLSPNDHWIFMHIPGKFILKSREDTKNFITSSSTTGHFDIFRHPGENVPNIPEW